MGLSQGIGLVWESYKLDPYVNRFAEAVFTFQEKVEDLLVLEEQLDADVRSLETCPYSSNTFGEILKKIQDAVDDLSLKQYSNLQLWVARLDEEVERKLAARLQAGIQAWTKALQGKKEEVDLSMDTDAPDKPTHKPGGDPQVFALTSLNLLAYLIKDCVFFRSRLLFTRSGSQTRPCTCIPM